MIVTSVTLGAEAFGGQFVNDFEAYDQSGWLGTSFRDIIIDDDGSVTTFVDARLSHPAIRPFDQLYYRRYEPQGKPLTDPVMITDSSQYATTDIIRVGNNLRGAWVVVNYIRENCSDWPHCRENLKMWTGGRGGGLRDTGVAFGSQVLPVEDNHLACAAMGSGGGIAVCWYNSQNTSGSAIWLQLFDADRSALTDTIRVTGNLFRQGSVVSSVKNPAIAMTPGGKFVVTWQANCAECPPPGGVQHIFARIFASDGMPLTDEICVSCDGDSAFPWKNGGQYPDVAIESDGDFAVTWRLYINDCRSLVFLRRFSADGAAKGPQILIDSELCAINTMSCIASDSIGNIIVAWQDDEGIPAGLANLKAKRFSPAGEQIGEEFQINDGYKNVLFVSTPVALNNNGQVGFLWGELLTLADGKDMRQHDIMQLMDLRDVGIYLCGDANNDRTLDARDPALLLNYVLEDGQPPANSRIVDVNGDGSVTLADAVRLISSLAGSAHLACPQ
jgi:hypothetical protein